VEYLAHVRELTAGARNTNAVAVRTARSGPELDKDAMGYPLLPPPPTDKNKHELLQGQKDLIRAFVVIHYRKDGSHPISNER